MGCNEEKAEARGGGIDRVLWRENRGMLVTLNGRVSSGSLMLRFDVWPIKFIAAEDTAEHARKPSQPFLDLLIRRENQSIQSIPHHFGKSPGR